MAAWGTIATLPQSLHRPLQTGALPGHFLRLWKIWNLILRLWATSSPVQLQFSRKRLYATATFSSLVTVWGWPERGLPSSDVRHFWYRFIDSYTSASLIFISLCLLSFNVTEERREKTKESASSQWQHPLNMSMFHNNIWRRWAIDR